jgi:AraC-like DNA-binding protein
LEIQRTLFNSRPGTEDLTVLFAGESITYPKHSVGPQIRDYFLIHDITSGRGVFCCRGNMYRLSAGDSFFIFPGELIQYEADEFDPWQYCWVALEGRHVPDLMRDLEVTPDKPVAAPVNARWTLAAYRRLLRCLEQGGARCGLQSTAYALLILSGYMRDAEVSEGDGAGERSVAHEQVEQAIRYLALHYYQPISIGRIARELGYHRTHFCKLFKQIAGLSPYQYLTKVRMTQAALLLQKSIPVQQVASAVGYSDPLHFSRQFRKYYGMPPSRFVEQGELL